MIHCSAYTFPFFIYALHTKEGRIRSLFVCVHVLYKRFSISLSSFSPNEINNVQGILKLHHFKFLSYLIFLKINKTVKMNGIEIKDIENDEVLKIVIAIVNLI